MVNGNTSLSVDQEVGERFRKLKKKSTASTNTEFIEGLIDDSESVEVNLADLDTVEIEKSEEAKETRAMAVGILEAMQQTGIKEDVIDLIEELRKREMVETNKKVVSHIVDKSQSGEPLNEADRALLQMVVDIESSRSEEGPATAIAEGLFGETESLTTETTTTERHTDEQRAKVTQSKEDSETLFTGIEHAEDSQ